MDFLRFHFSNIIETGIAGKRFLSAPLDKYAGAYLNACFFFSYEVSPDSRLLIHPLFRKSTKVIPSRTHSSKDKIKYTEGIGNFQTNALSSPNGTPKIHVPIKSTHMIYFVFPPLRMIPPPNIMFWTFTGAITAKATRRRTADRRTSGST